MKEIIDNIMYFFKRLVETIRELFGKNARIKRKKKKQTRKRKMTNGNKKVLNSKDLNLHKFFDLNKNKKYQKTSNIVRTEEQMKELAIKILEENEIDESYEYYNFIKRYATGQTVLNKYGKKLYFKLGDINK